VSFQLISHYFPELTTRQLKQLKGLKRIYEDWNSKVNVISRKDMDCFYLHHVLHSLSIAKVVQFKARAEILDVGTGGGFPLIPLAILFPESRFFAIDSIGKKVKVVRHVAHETGLKNVQCRQIRAEQMDGEFDFIVSRAVSRTKKLISWVDGLFKQKSIHSLKNGFLFLKGGDLQAELDETGRFYQCFQLADYFEEEYFETKKVVYMNAGH